MAPKTNPASESIKHARKTGGTVIMQSTDKKETYKITPDRKLTARPSKGTQPGHTVTDSKNFSRPTGGASGIGLGAGLPEQMK